MTVAATTERQQSVVALVASVGIFVGTALLSQWIQQKKQKRCFSKGQPRLLHDRSRSHRLKLGQPRRSGGPLALPALPPPALPPLPSRRRRKTVLDDNEDVDDSDLDDDYEAKMQYRFYRMYFQQQQQQKQQQLQQEQQGGWEDEEIDKDNEDDEYWDAARDSYVRRRLEDRLSFYGGDDDEDDDDDNEAEHEDGDKIRSDVNKKNKNSSRSPIAAKEPAESFDNFPKNSNWNHFERCHGEVTRDSHHRISSTCNVQVDHDQQQQLSLPQPQYASTELIADDVDDDISIEGSDDYSLEGEHATSNHHGDGSDFPGDSEDDASTLTSQFHFVWTGAHYHHHDNNNNNKQSRPRPPYQPERLAVIHSERDLNDLVPLEAFVPVEQEKASAAIVSTPTSLHQRGASSSSSFSSSNSNVNNNSTDSSPPPSPPPRRDGVAGSGKTPSRPGGSRSNTLSNSRAAAASPILTRSQSKRTPSTSAMLSSSPAPSTGASNKSTSGVPPKQRRKHQVRIVRSSTSPSTGNTLQQHAHVAAAAATTRRRLQQSSSCKKIMNPHLQARAKYNARIMPDKLILVRHGQSRGNTDESVYSKIPDNLVPLTELGWEQARQAGRRLRNDILKASSASSSLTAAPPRQVHFIVSPYVRTVETFHGIVSAWCDPSEFSHIPNRDARIKAWYSKLVEMGISWAEDPRIREQDFGNLQDPKKIKQSKQERHNFGAFYYRFGSGESAADVFDRMSTFLDSLWRSFDMNQSQYFVLVTHGISIRVLLSRYFRYTVDQFHLLSNPRNCEMVELEHDGKGRLRMAGRHELEECLVSDQSTLYDADQRQEQEPEETSRPQQKEQRRILRYRYHERLRVLPPEFVRTTHIRISPDDVSKKKPTTV